MSILITGGTGFIGVELARRLLEHDEEIVLFDVAINKRVESIRDRVKIVQGDLRTEGEVFNAVKENKVEGIYHLGAMLSIPSNRNPWSSFQVNILGTMHVLEAARLFDVGKVLFASTGGTYGLGIRGTLTDETIQRPTNMYGIGKLYGELIGRFYHNRFGLDFRSVRFCPGVVGPGVKGEGLTQYNARMIEAAILGKPYECYVTEETRYPLVYIKDAVRALYMCYEAPQERIKTMAYNLDGIPAVSAKEVEQTIRKFIPDAKVIYKPDPVVMDIIKGVKYYEIDAARAREEWGWYVEYSNVEKIIEDFIVELRTHAEYYGLS